MLMAKLLLVVSIGQAPGKQADPSVLVAQLGSARYAEREAASEALERLGRPALPALRAARDSRDLEIRTRAYRLIHRIEGSLLTQPSRLRLDFDNAPLTEVVRSFGAQAGFKVALSPEDLPRWKHQRVTLRAPEPIPFWKAIDRLCDAAQLQYNPGVHGFNPGVHGFAGAREPAFTLTDGAIRTVTPVWDHGPFRVSLLSLDYRRHLDYGGVGVGPRPLVGNDRGGRPRAGAPSRLNPVTHVQFAAELLVAAEPRLTLSQDGPLQVLEAVDDRGNSLIPAGGAGFVTHRFAGYFGVSHGSVLQLQAPLHRPATAGESIKKLRGEIPLLVSSRRPDPLVVPLTRGTGQRFANPDVELTLHEIRGAPNTPQTLIELSVKPNERGTSGEPGEADPFHDAIRRPEPQPLQLEVLDSRDQPVPWFPMSVDSETSHVTLMVTNPAPAASLKELRYHTLTRATLSVPFEFRDIPMP